MDTELESSTKIYSSLKDLYYKGIEIGIASATACSVIGTSVGFILAWGPVICGLLTSFLGFALGYGIYVLIKKKDIKLHPPKRLPEMIIIVQCLNENSKLVIDTMWKYKVLSVGKAQFGTS